MIVDGKSAYADKWRCRARSLQLSEHVSVLKSATKLTRPAVITHAKLVQPLGPSKTLSALASRLS